MTQGSKLTPEMLADLNRRFEQNIPFNRALGMEVLQIERGLCVMKLPYRDELVGHADTGVLHGGAITALMDACGGTAVFMKLDEAVPIATLDLRVDYMRSATPGRDVIARTECFRATRNVAFVRGVAYHDTPDEPIATVAASFMVGTKDKQT